MQAEPQQKRCTKCKIVKPLSEFYTAKGKPYAVQHSCKACWSEYRKTPEHKAAKSVWRKASHRKDPRKAMLDLAKHRAKRDGLPIDITIEDIAIPEFCPILGIQLKVNDGLKKDDSPTLDKLIPSLGYVKGNVYVISHRANRLKTDATVEELSAIVKYIKERLPE